MQRAPVRAYLGGFLLLGLASSFAGPALVHLRDRVGTTDGGIAGIFIGHSLGYIAGSLFGGRLIDDGRGHRAWSAAMGVSVASIVGVAAAPRLGWLIAAFAVLGLSGGVADVSGNTLSVWSRPGHAAPLLNRMHLCFALGALAAPLVVSRSLSWFGGSLGPVAAVAGALAVFSITGLLSRPTPRRVEVEAPAPVLLPRARGGQLAAVCLFFFLYVAVETGVASWIHSYVVEIEPQRQSLATAVNAAFWVGFVAGRVVAIAIAGRIRPGQLVAACSLGALVSAIVFATIAERGAALLAVVIVFAMTIAPMYASMVSYAEQHLSLSGSSTAAFVATSGIGGLVLPWGIGQLFDRYGADSLPPTILVATVATIASAAAVKLAVSRGAAAGSLALPATPPL